MSQNLTGLTLSNHGCNKTLTQISRFKKLWYTPLRFVCRINFTERFEYSNDGCPVVLPGIFVATEWLLIGNDWVDCWSTTGT